MSIEKIKKLNMDVREMTELMLQMIEINSGKGIDQSIADGTLQADVKSAQERFKKESENDTE